MESLKTDLDKKFADDILVKTKVDAFCGWMLMQCMEDDHRSCLAAPQCD